jgi:hypothetical protein
MVILSLCLSLSLAYPGLNHVLLHVVHGDCQLPLCGGIGGLQGVCAFGLQYLWRRERRNEGERRKRGEMKERESE